jgi:hypothetical protein
MLDFEMSAPAGRSADHPLRASTRAKGLHFDRKTTLG